MSGCPCLGLNEALQRLRAIKADVLVSGAWMANGRFVSAVVTVSRIRSFLRMRIFPLRTPQLLSPS